MSLYRYVYLNQPRLTRLAGIVLILAVGARHAIEAPERFRAAAYLGVLFAVDVAATLYRILSRKPTNLNKGRLLRWFQGVCFGWVQSDGGEWRRRPA